jgi:hypothetical protein
MPTKPKAPAEKFTAADWTRLNKQNSQNSPWRQAAKHGSARQRRNARYFEELAAKGDTRRVPRPELDED